MSILTGNARDVTVAAGALRIEGSGRFYSAFYALRITYAIAHAVDHMLEVQADVSAEVSGAIAPVRAGEPGYEAGRRLAVAQGNRYREHGSGISFNVTVLKSFPDIAVSIGRPQKTSQVNSKRHIR